VARRAQNPSDPNFRAFLEDEPEDCYLAALSLSGHDATARHLESVDVLVGDAVDEVILENSRIRREKERKQKEAMQQRQQNSARAQFDVKSGVMQRRRRGSQEQQRRRLTDIKANAGIEIEKDDMSIATPKKIAPEWRRSNPNKGRQDIARPLQKSGAIAWVFKEGSREYGAVIPPLTPEEQERRRLARYHGVDRGELSNRIIQDYDFIAVSERFDESMVALMMLLDLPMSDILYVPGQKQSQSFDEGKDGQCYFMWKPFITSGMKSYFESEEWQDRIKYDLAIYDAANRSLDLTIQSLGVKQFERNMAKFLDAQRVVYERCYGKTDFPCDMGGRVVPVTDCLHRDSGCGNDCLDRVATELRLQ